MRRIFVLAAKTLAIAAIVALTIAWTLHVASWRRPDLLRPCIVLNTITALFATAVVVLINRRNVLATILTFAFTLSGAVVFVTIEAMTLTLRYDHRYTVFSAMFGIFVGYRLSVFVQSRLSRVAQKRFAREAAELRGRIS